MLNKDEYLEKLKSQYDEWNYKWNIELNKLEAKAQKAETTVKKEYEKKISDLYQKRDEMQVKFKELQESGEGAWEDLKDGTEKAWNSLKEAFNKAKSHF